MAKRYDMNNDWLFSLQYTEEMMRRDYEEQNMERVRLPHTVVETPYNCFDESIYQMVSGYRKHFAVPSEWHHRRVRLTFEGVAHSCVVYVNGQESGMHSGGYTAFSIDVSDKLRYGEDNVITVRVDSRESQNIPPFGYVVDYMTYGGIYREVYLEVSEKQAIADVFLQTGGLIGAPILTGEAALFEPAGEAMELRIWIEKEGQESLLGGVIFAPGEKRQYFSVDPGNVGLWNHEHPTLYRVKFQLLRSNTKERLDERTYQHGFRWIEWKADGLYVNGEKVKLRGLNRHQSFPYVGYAMPKSLQIEDARILKEELGCNAVRTSHYPQSQHFIDACDRLGLYVFTEIPGWQYIGDASWKKRAVKNTEEMVLQYRNHPSIILWGVRINESADLDEFYQRTGEVAHRLDPTRATGGVRAHRKSHLLEDVYTYNDFVHEGRNRGCEKKRKITPDRSKAYLISEYNGHMYPGKSFDWEEHRREHALRHANVLDAIAKETDIAGGFGWCMFDYNTHKDFGSGDRICYHGVLDMYRNPKLASLIYACEGSRENILEISSSMDIGEHPGCNRGKTWIFTNADSVKMYKNDRLLKEYHPEESPYRNLTHGPILIDEFVGEALKEEHYRAGQEKTVRYLLNKVAVAGLGGLGKRDYLKAVKLMLLYRMKQTDAVAIYNKYIGDWGGSATTYRFEAIRDGKVVRTVVKAPCSKLHLTAMIDHNTLTEEATYDVAAVRIQIRDEYENVMPYCQEPVELSCEGPIELIGPKTTVLRGGACGTYVKSMGKEGSARLRIRCGKSELSIPLSTTRQHINQV
ncbi:MAG: glycoside hydrolase family 2 protein [Lachnospiraceae bacterium]|nr:glycoside hydrolase family 2 protein [Lachnospiraceae bacterium]